MSNSNAEPSRQSDTAQDNTKICLTWGNKIGKKYDDTIRIAFQNINGFGYKKEERYRGTLIREFMTQFNIDIMGMAEINANWKRIQKKENIWTRIIKCRRKWVTLY